MPTLNQIDNLWRTFKRDERISNHFEMDGEDAFDQFSGMSEKQFEYLKNLYRYGNIRKPDPMGNNIYKLLISIGLKPKQ